jgi:kinesin family protein 18/19
MRELYRRIDATNDEWETHVTVSFLEIYNELIRDLLADDFPACPRGGLSLREDEKNRITVAGLSQKTPRTADEVLEYVLLGNSRRHTSATHANSQSSRSHAVLQVNIGRRPRGGDTVDLETETVTTAITSATLSIIDLAGSERASATQNMGNRMKEGANINKSLLSLGNCINALCVAATKGNSQPHIPYRDSKLTRLLKFSLGGNCRTVMIVCVSPCSVHLEDTGNTLKYANRAKNIVTKVSRNVNDVNRNITQYLKAIAEKDARIKQLEAEMANGSRTEHAAREKRLAEGRAEMARVKADMRQAATRHAPVIADGALCRALVDGAELRIGALRARLTELENSTEPEFEAERETLQALIAREQTLYASNPTNQARIQDATTKSDLLSAVLRAASERRFDKLESSDIEGLRLEAELQRVKSEMQSLEAREKAYRGAIAHQARALTRLIGGMVRTMTVLQGQVEDGSALGPLVRENEQTIAKVLDMGAAGDAPPRHVSPMFAAPVVKPPPNPLRRWMSTATGSLPPLVKPSPAMKRIQQSHIGSPIRHASPRKRSAGVAVFAKQKKTLRWRDEAGEGSIGSVRIKSDDSQTAGTTDSDSTPTPSPLPKLETMDPEENGWIDEASAEESAVFGDSSAQTTIVSLPPARPLPFAGAGITQRLPAKRPPSGLSQVTEESSFMERSPRRPVVGTISIPKAHAMRPVQRRISGG